MEDLNDIDLVNNIKEDIETENSLKLLIERHSGIYLDIVNSYMRSCPYPNLKTDIINDKDLTIYNSALKYNESRGAKFSTFLGNEAKWKCLNASNKNKRIGKFIEMNESKFVQDEENPQIPENKFKFEEEVLQSFNEELKNQPDERIKEIFLMRYSGNRKLTPWRKISEKMNLSIQGCINIHNAALENISKNIKNKYEIIN